MRLLFSLLLFLCAPLAFAQTTIADMLVRIERMQSADDSRCIVVYNDASYHAERMHGSKTDVFEGTIDSGRFSTVKDIATGDALKQVQHEHLASTRYIKSPDMISVDVMRTDNLQQIRFANKEDRGPFSAQMDPLLQWFESTMKHPGASSTAKPNRCLPEKKETTRVIAGIPPKASAGPEIPYNLQNLLLLFTTERYEGNANSFGEKTCTLVHNDGTLYAYKITARYRGENDSYRELHAKLTPEQVARLKQAMDDPVLANSKGMDAPVSGVAREGDRTEVVAVRNNDVQRIRFWQLTATRELGATPRQGYQPSKGNDGSKETEPLRNWVKKNIDNSSFQKVDHLSGECP